MPITAASAPLPDPMATAPFVDLAVEDAELFAEDSEVVVAATAVAPETGAVEDTWPALWHSQY
jgi:hypothetical protein